MRLIDMTGKRCGRLTVISRAPNEHDLWGERTYSVWNCLCDCGNKKTVKGCDLRRGRVRSCGCLRLKKVREAML